MDDRFTGYDADTVCRMGFDGGKMLLRIDPDDPLTVRTLEACGRAVSELAGRRLIAMVEPFISRRVDSRVSNDLSADAMIRAISIASGLGSTSAYTWLKVPVVPEMSRVMAASTLPALLLGGDAPATPGNAFSGWREALQIPSVRGTWPAARCSTRPMATSPGRSIRLWACFSAARPHRKPGRNHGYRIAPPGGNAGVGTILRRPDGEGSGLVLQRAAGA